MAKKKNIRKKSNVFWSLTPLAIIIVAVQSWFGVICPLTSFEMTLRSQGGGGVYSGSFIAHLLESILYYRAPAWVFTVC